MNSKTQRSNFVTPLSWIFIALSGFATFISIAQNIMIGFMFDHSFMNEIQNAPGSENIPAFFRFMILNIRLFFLAFLIVSSTTLVSSIGLLKRKNWGRIVFMIIMGLGIAWTAFGVFMQFTMFPQMMNGIADTAGADRFRMMYTVMRVFSLVFAAALCCLFGWIIKKLSSKTIKSEFLT